ncbi:MAG: hypothetical protein CM1200mP27_01070 [Chloroflexota bacterium]|nr:MAG: hypothetical protein CM1200mP27_01070 [Chloroflexota bacterium]
MATTEINLRPADFKGKSNPDWCPGCGDFGVLNAIQRAVAELGFPGPHEIMTVSGKRVLFQFAGVHQHLRYAHPPRSIFGYGHWRQDGQS